MQKVALIILISFFSVFDLFPQVIIKERVEIKPEKYLKSASLEEHTIIFNLQWDRPSVQATVVGVSIPCQSAGADWQYGGSISLTVDNARAGLYWFQPRVNQNPYDTTRFYYQLYFDGEIVRNDSTVLIGGFSSGSYPYFNVQYTPPLISDYSFNPSNELCYKKFGEIVIGTSNNCATGVSWNSSTNLINLTITSGQEFASFYHYDFSSGFFPTVELLGDNIEVTLAELEDISLEQDSLFNGNSVKVNVQAEWGRVIKTDSATAYPASEYVVSAESYGVEEINTGEEVFMELNVLSDLSCSFCLPLYETYNAEIIKGGKYGSLIDPVTGESVHSLTGIEQYTFGPGQPCGVADLDYKADGISADTEDSVIIRISTSDPQIQPTDKLFLIQPSPVVVTITPDTLSPGDTASIVIKKRNTDGTIEDFPPDQAFEIGIAEGCMGNLFACDGEDCYLEPYFYGIPNSVPVYFVADSSADSGIVKIRVGVIDDGGIIGAGIAAPSGSTGFKKIGKEKPKVVMKKNRSVEEKVAFIKDVKSKINNSALSTSEKQKMIEKLNILASPNAESSACFVGDFIASTFSTANVTIATDSLAYFELAIIPDTLAEKDTLAFAEAARLIIQAKDVDSADVGFNSSKLLTLKIETNENYGTFINMNGDTLKTTPVVLNSVTYGDARKGLIKFAAVKENPDSVVKCLIKVSLQEDATKNGEREAVVLEQTLKLIVDSPLEVEPIITRRKYDENYRDYINNTTDDNIKQLRVRLTRGGKFVHHYKFKLSTKYILSSGGHDHMQFPRPDSTERLIWQNYGRFYSYQIDSTKNPLIEATLLDTIPNRFNYIASIWGDIMKIYLYSTQNPLLKDSVEITERIPSLDRLQPNENIVLIGGTTNHHGPPGYQDDHNHYGTNIMRTHILDIATEYRTQLPEEPLLNINDMSLPFGGKFDINGRWRGSHVDHRTGRNVDIQSRNMEGDRYLDANHNGIYDPDPNSNPDETLLYDANNNGLYDGDTLEIFRSICEDNGSTWVLLENPSNQNGYPEHWHLEF